MEYKSWIVGVYWKEEWEANGKVKDFSKNAFPATTLTFLSNFHRILLSPRSFIPVLIHQPLTVTRVGSEEVVWSGSLNRPHF
jgi:hypothetical protein